jgi:hypothetical protein
MDSRDYIWALTINNAGDVPADFDPPAAISDLVAGVFLPQSEPDWLRRRAYPARILLLTHEALWVVAHPRAKEQTLVVPLRDIAALECGRILLIGWIGLRWGGLQQELGYNRRGSLIVEKFLATLKASWLATEIQQTEIELPGRRDYGTAPGSKFEYALETELIDDQERPRIRFFHPSILRARRGSFRNVFRKETRSAADLILLTQRRLLWITEHRGATCTPYGTVSCSAPFTAVADVSCQRAEHEPELRISLRSGEIWRLPLDDSDETEARLFAEVIRSALAGRKTPQ